MVKKLTITLLAGAALAMPSMGAALAQSSPQNPQKQPAQAEQQNGAQNNQNAAQNKPQQPDHQQANQQQPNPQNGGNQQQASNQTISPHQLGQDGVKQVQQALNKAGFNAGQPDGKWGPRTHSAMTDFQKSKQIPDKGQLNQQTLSDLGVNVASNENPGDQNGNQNDNQNAAPNGNQDQK